MSQEHQEEVIRHIIVRGDTLFLFSKIVRELSFKVRRPRSKNDLVAVDRFAFNHQSNVAKLFLVQDRQIVSRVRSHGERSHAGFFLIVRRHFETLSMDQNNLLGLVGSQFFRLLTLLTRLTLFAVAILYLASRSARILFFFFVVVLS